MKAIPLELVRTLPMSAASGLLLINEKFYVVADDELNLSTFTTVPNDPGEKVILFPGELPEDYKDRKKKKPDFEALLHFSWLDLVLVIPSGSTRSRNRGAQIYKGQVEEINFSHLYENLSSQIMDLNIEGAVIDPLAPAQELKLFHRGNGPREENFVISLDLKLAVQELVETKALTFKCFKRQVSIDLGNLNAHRLSFTDAATDGQNIWYLAVAENTQSTYDDGEYQGSVLGCMNSRCEILFQQELNCAMKPEGLALDITNKKFFVVTDADNRKELAQLLVGDLPQI